MDAATRTMIEKQFADLPEEFRSKLEIGDKMVKTVSSQTCPAGTKGRMAIFEMFAVDKEIESAILKSPTELDIFALVRKKGMRTMKEDALLKAVRGDIPMTEVYKF